MRTQEEIAKRIKDNTSLFNFAGEALIAFLDYEHGLPLLEGPMSKEKWDSTKLALTEEGVLTELREYMEFAWGKVENHRGISASRSVEKCNAYVWLLGNDTVLADVEAAGYAQYGAPKLAVICRAYDLPIPDDGAVQRMIQGERCGNHDECGCGE